MTYSPAQQGIPTSSWVCSYGKETMATALTAAPSSGTHGIAASIIRIVLPTATTIRRFYWANGATVGTDNVQVGIYNDDLSTFLLGAATLSAGANVLQFVTPTATPIKAGRYWMALVASGGIATVLRNLNTNVRGAGLYTMASASPLPATLVPASASSGLLALFGFTSTT